MTTQAIVRLCADDDEDVRQSACDAVAIISLHDTNKKKLLSTHNCVQNLVTCCNAEQPDGARCLQVQLQSMLVLIFVL